MALPAGVDRDLNDGRAVEDPPFVVGIIRLDTERPLLADHRGPAMESEGERDAEIRRGVGERAMQHLAIDNGGISPFAGQRHRARQALAAAVFRDQLLDIDMPVLVGTGHDPEAVPGRARVKLDLKIETVNSLVPIRRVPMGDAVLVPGNRAAETRLLDEDRVIIGNEVLAVDRLGDRQKGGMAVEAQARFHRLAHTAHQEECVFRRIRVGGGLRHLARVPPREHIGAPPRVGQRFHKDVGFTGEVQAQRRSALGVHFRVRSDGGALDHVGGVGTKLRELRRSDHPFKDVIAVFPVGGQDVRMELAVGIETDRPAIADLASDAFALAHIFGHAGGMFRPCRRGVFDDFVHCSSPGRPGTGFIWHS